MYRSSTPAGKAANVTIKLMGVMKGSQRDDNDKGIRGIQVEGLGVKV